MPAEKIGVFSEATAREILRRTHIHASGAPSEGLAGPDGYSTRPVPLGEQWWGIVTALGPASEADYTGPQYWVETANITNSVGSNPPNTTLPALAAQSYPNENTRWVTATNLAEVPGGSHLLQAGVLVLVAEMYGLDESPYYVFEALPVSSMQLYVQSVQANYLTCNTQVGGGGTTYYVGKPTRLRSTDTAARHVAGQTYTVTKSGFTTGVTSGDAQTCTATRSSDSGTDTLEVVEPYLAGDEIAAIPYPTGLTTVGGVPINLLDVNVDARHWAVKASS
jgi:hypothetical protein